MFNKFYKPDNLLELNLETNWDPNKGGSVAEHSFFMNEPSYAFACKRRGQSLVHSNKTALWPESCVQFESILKFWTSERIRKFPLKFEKINESGFQIN